MSKTIAINLKNDKGLINAIQSYKMISKLSESEIETLEILSNKKDTALLLKSIEESKKNNIHPISSIL